MEKQPVKNCVLPATSGALQHRLHKKAWSSSLTVSHGNNSFHLYSILLLSVCFVGGAGDILASG